MSPAAVEIRSSVSKSSAAQNPNPTFSSFAHDNYAQNHQGLNVSATPSSSSFSFSSDGNATESGFDAAFSSQSRERTRPGMSGRLRPRLVKLRKQLHDGTTRNGNLRKIGSGFNPFQQTGERPPSAKNDTIDTLTGFSLGYLNSSCVNDGKGVSNGNVGSVFLVDGIDCAVKLNSGEGEPGGNETKLVSDGEERNAVENYSELSTKHECTGFVFGANSINAEANFYWEKRKFPETMEVKSEGEVECMKFENAGFIFGTTRSDVGAQSKSGKGENSKSAAELVSSNEEKSRTEPEVGRDSNGGFVFGAYGNNSISNSNLAESSGKVGKQHIDDLVCTSVDVPSELSSTSGSKSNESIRAVGDSGSGIVFGASWFNLMSNLNLGESEQDGNSGKLVSDDQGNVKAPTETEAWKAEDTETKFCNGGKDGVSIFGGSDKRKAEDAEIKFRPVGDEGVFVFGSSVSKTSIVNECVASKLTHETEVNSENFQNLPRAEASDDLNNVNVNPAFVFISDKKNFNSSNENLETSHDHESEYTACTFKTAFKDNANTRNVDHMTFHTTCNRDSSGIGNSSSKLFEFQVGVGKSSNLGQFFQGVEKDVRQNRAAVPSVSSHGLSLQENSSISGAASTDGIGKNNENISTSTPEVSGVPFTNFNTPQWDPNSFKASLFVAMSRKLEFTGRGPLPKDRKLKKMKGKSKQSARDKQRLQKDNVVKEEDSQENPNSPGYCSPMDFSPYQETAAANQFSKASPDQRCSKPNEKSPSYEKFSSGDCKLETFGFGSQTSCSSSDGGVAAAEDEDPFVAQRERGNCTMQFCFAMGSEDKKSFIFSSSSSVKGSISSRKHRSQKKTRTKLRNSSVKAMPSQNDKPTSSTAHSSPSSSVLDSGECQKEDKSTSQSEIGNKSEAGVKVEQGSTVISMISETCETWRLRGNQAYRNGNLAQAEVYYTHGINAVPSSESLGCSIKPLVLCYSNRAATLISLGRLREALGDCMTAVTLDPSFLKAYLRAANCHLVLGEVENALQYFHKCLKSGGDVCLDRRTTIEAANGLQEAQRVVECTTHATKLLEQKTSDATLSALEKIAEALTISSCSEKLLQMKAEALFVLRRYEEVVKLCELTLHVAETKFSSVSSLNPLPSADGFDSDNYSLARVWRTHYISKAYFYMGKLEVALDLLQKQEQVGSINDKRGSGILESSLSLAAAIRELLSSKNAGNEAVRSQRYAHAIEHYTVALSRNVESRPFTAICLCNRAAAHQALGQIVDAIADCSLAMALDGKYIKAVSRRATLHEIIRDYGQAASDLRRLVDILENQSDKVKSPGSTIESANSLKELKQACRRLSAMEEAKKENPLDLYLILGIKTSDTASDIKKAYRRAALKHHPDKAGQFLARSVSGDEGQLWREIAQEVHKDADRIFKMIGEAYAVLSDTTKRSEYDFEEEIRKERASEETYGSGPFRGPSKGYSYQYERTTNRRNWRGSQKTYSNPHDWW